jgi:hypothetical protein
MSHIDISDELAHAPQSDRTMADPLMPAKIAAREVTKRLHQQLEVGGAVHVESLICALGSLAGYACQVAVSSRATRGASKQVLTAHAQHAGGHFLGDALYKVLAESRHSVWKIAANGAELAGCKALPDLAEILSHTSVVLGTESFGVPRMPKQHRAGDLPMNYVRKYWIELKAVTERACPSPEQWPIVFALAIRDSLIAHKDKFEPGVALRLAMESASAMTKAALDEPVRAFAAARKPAAERAAQPEAQPAKTQTFSYSTSGTKLLATYLVTVAIPAACVALGYMWLAGATALVALVVIVRMHAQGRVAQEIVLRSDGVSLPTSGTSPRMVSLRYDEIRRVEMKHSTCLLVVTAKGDCEVLQQRFENEFEFSRFAHTLAGRANVSLAME